MKIRHQDTNTNAAPYFDDYDADKGFHQILYRPKTIQARELNQGQSILQSQINRFARHIFEEGSVVLPGGISIKDGQASIGVSMPTTPSIEDIQLVGDTHQIFVKSTTTNLTAKVLKVIPSDASGPTTLFLEYENSGDNKTTKLFTPSENLVLFYINEANETIQITNATCGALGQGLWVKCLSGVYFARGFFVLTGDQEVVLAKLVSNTRSCKVGFKVVEQIVTEVEDTSLLSNALGETNFRADGAHRLKITLELIVKELADTAPDTAFIELLTFENGAIKKKIDTTQYSQLANTLAQRTFEESGDYTVTPFGIEFKEHLKLTAIDGVATAAEGGVESNMAVVVKPGIAYVSGFRVENVGNQNVITPKARDTIVANNTTIPASFGSYVLVNTLFSLPPIDVKKSFLMRDSTNATVGTCSVRGIRKESATLTRIYIFDMKFNANKTLNNVTTIAYSDGSNLFSATLVQSVLFDGAKNRLVFPLAYSSVKTLKQLGVTDTSYSVTRAFTATTGSATNATATISLTGNESFGSMNDWEWFVGFSGVSNAGTTFSPSVITIGGTPYGSSVTVNLGTNASYKNKEIRLIAPVIKQVALEKTKTLITTFQSVTFAASNFVKLSKADVYKIVDVIDNSTGNSLLDYFKLDSGHRESWYDVSQLQTRDGIAITRAVTVTYTYFEHSAGDYFSADSYASTGVLRKDIPKMTIDGRSVSLADCLDFRPMKDVSGNFTSLTVFGEIIKPDDTIRADVEFYLDRMDTVYVNSKGEFAVANGQSALKPDVPKIPDGTMRLYDLFVPAYTEDLSAIKVRMTDNKRYTMRDIGKIEKRVETVEYYVSLSMLENKANNTQVIDPLTGNSRFKNGFAVDGFTDHSLSDTTHPEWAASMDVSARTLNVPFVQNVVDLKELSKDANAYRRNGIFSLAFTERKDAEQPYATRTVNINPYAVFTWAGSLKMNPASDFWKDVIYSAPSIINNTVNNRPAGLVEGSTVLSRISNNWWDVWRTDSGAFLAEYLVTDTTEVVNTVSFTESNDSTITADTVLSAVELPWMRTIDITIKGDNFKPFTRLYPFFEGVNISAFVEPEGGVFGDSVVTDASGSFTSIFRVPSSEGTKFKTGTSVVRFTDDINDSRHVDLNFTSGQGLFYSGGSLITRQKEITNTRTLSAISNTNTVSTSTWNFFTDVESRDPIAQTFRVSTPGGGFVSKVDIAFATKAAAIPVTLQIRTVETGLPSGLLVPFGEVVLKPSQVQTSADGSVMTSFVFSDIVYLEEGKEYAIVLLADTQEYNVYIAQMGQNVIGQNTSIAKQPHTGVFFQSSNGSTWTPCQEMDLKFTVWCADFVQNTQSEVVFSGGDIMSMPNDIGTIMTTVASDVAVIKIYSHGLKAGDSFVIEGASAGNGFTVSMLNKNHVVTSVSGDFVSFIPSPGNNASVSGYIGGVSIKCKCNYAFGLFFANFERMVLPGTAITWQYSYKLQNSRSNSPWVNFTPNTNTGVASEGVVLGNTDFKVRALLSTTKSNLSPVIDTTGMSTVLIEPRINSDANAPFACYVTKDVVFNNPSTSARFFVGAKLPNTTQMQFYYKLVQTPGEDMSLKPWVLLNSTKPLVNSAKPFFEYEYQLADVGSFVGYKTKIVLLGTDVTQLPMLKDYRSIAIA